MSFQILITDDDYNSQYLRFKQLFYTVQYLKELNMKSLDLLNAKFDESDISKCLLPFVIFTR